jgi:hypothetical protein
MLIALTASAQLPPVKRQATIMYKEPSVQIQCASGAMLITIKNAPANYDGVFSGMVYPKGLSKNSTCLTEYRSHKGPLKYKLPLRSCNTMPQETDDGGIEFFNTIVLQPHLKLVTDLGRGYHIRCRYKSREAAIKSTNFLESTVQNPQAFTSDEAGDRRDYGRSLIDSHNINEVPMPACHMKIYSENKLADNVKIGDPLKLIVSVDKQEKYGLHVTDCLVRDGLGWGEQKLIDESGCPLDQEILGPFSYDSDRREAAVAFPAHKFPYTTSVYYQCNVKLCLLKDVDCHKTPTCQGNKSRPKRDTTSDEEGLPATIEVFSGLHVNEDAEVINDDYDSVFKERADEDAICVSQRSFAIAISIAGLCLMLAVILAVLCLMARRRGKTVSNSGSSIYSGPYTNTAFSHSS